MRSRYLPVPLYENFDKTYSKFQEIYSDPKKRSRLFGKFVFIDYKEFIERKSKFFWHLSSIDKTEKYTVNPCTNEVPIGICKYINHCEEETSDDLIEILDRIPCIYRGSRIAWIDEVIKLATLKSKLVKVWKVDNRKKSKTKLKVRFQEGTADYIIIFEEDNNRNSYRLITAFPVVLKGSKRKFDKQYERYQKTKKPAGS